MRRLFACGDCFDVLEQAGARLDTDPARLCVPLGATCETHPPNIPAPHATRAITVPDDVRPSEILRADLPVELAALATAPEAIGPVTELAARFICAAPGVPASAAVARARELLELTKGA